MASGRDRRYESSTSTTECSSSCPSPSSSHMSQFAYRPSNNAPKYGTMVPNRIFVGGLTAGTTELELLQLFSAYGNVKTTKVINDRAGVSKGYGFVTFETEEEAQRLVQQETLVLNGRKLNIAPAIKKQPFSRVVSVPIGNQGGCMFIKGTPPCWFQNGVVCIMPQMPASQIPLETDGTNMGPRTDPLYRSTVMTPSGGYQHIYPISHHAAMYLPAAAAPPLPQYQYQPMQQSSVGLIPEGALPLPYLTPVLDRLY
ncbi:protein boule isoform X2 [Anabrus simplex]|uniref:protein boule isoform X2 n=1 Tax=Anabrus simplex TaxID=316456 RepID=UPI0034DD6573